MNALVKHAIENVWCSPRQDNSANIKLTRITGVGGAFNQFKVGWNTFGLPLSKTRFHVYQLGLIYASVLGIVNNVGSWVKVSDCCNQQKMLFDLYSALGYMYPRTECWYLITEDRNVLVAVKDQPNIKIKGDEDDVFLRIYTPSYFAYNDSHTTDDGFFIAGGTVLSVAEILALQNQLDVYRSKPGYVLCWVNGMKVNNINLITTKPGDVAEFLYDSSIYKVVRFKVKDLMTFDSEIDQVRKYLLHYAKMDDSGEINYIDDVDGFLLKNDGSGNHRGVYYHQYRPNSYRLVTHRDYTIPVHYLTGYVMDQATWGDPEELEFVLHIRKSGWVKPLINDANRIKELYKLSDRDIMGAMMGVDSVIDEWRIENLEKSAYTQIMGSASKDITPELVEDAYGYNTISRILGDSPAVVRIASNQAVVDVPAVMQTNSTAYEYDAAGKFVGMYTHPAGSVYACRNYRAAYVEFFSGFGTDLLEEFYGDAVILLNPRNTYRFYVCKKDSGVPDNKWVDVTGSGKYAIEAGRVTWFVKHDEYLTLVKGDGNFLAYNLKLKPNGSLLQFTLAHRARRNGAVNTYPMSLQMGRLDLFLNEHYLIEGLDYIMAFPKVVIVNKEYLNKPELLEQNIHIRWTGFCDANMKREGYKDVGFVQYGQLSRNSYFNLRDDRVIGIYVAGLYKTRNAFKFAEDTIAVDVLNPVNGRPYAIRDNVVQTRGLTKKNTYALRDIAIERDIRFEQYLTRKLPEHKPTQPNVINGLYNVFSPFLSKIIFDLKNEELTDPKLTSHYNDDFVRKLCKPYEWLLAFDPTQPDLKYDRRFVDVHPTNLNTVVEVSIYHYKFVTRVIDIYMKGKVSISHFLSIKNYGIED